MHCSFDVVALLPWTLSNFKIRHDITSCRLHTYGSKPQNMCAIYENHNKTCMPYAQSCGLYLPEVRNLYQNSVNLWRAWLLLYIVHITALHALGSWLAVNAICCCWGGFFEWICSVRGASSASQETHSSKEGLQNLIIPEVTSHLISKVDRKSHQCSITTIGYCIMDHMNLGV